MVTASEPLSLDAQQIYARLSDANDAATTAFLTGGLEPAAARQRYQADISAAAGGLQHVDRPRRRRQPRCGPGPARAGPRICRSTPGEIETARAYNRLGLPLGAAYLREASTLMRGTLLPAAQGLYGAENASLRHQRPGDRTAAPRVTVVIGLVICYCSTGCPGGCPGVPIGCSTTGCSPPPPRFLVIARLAG